MESNFFLFFHFNYRLIELSIEERNAMIPRAYDPSFKGALLRSLTATLYVNQLNYNNSNIFHVCKEKFMTIPVVIYARKDYYLIDEINEKILILQAAGLTEYWNTQTVDKKFFKVIATSSPITINMTHLFSCFIVWLFGLSFASIAFITELSIVSISK
jgi:hypothetical protein